MDDKFKFHSDVYIPKLRRAYWGVEKHSESTATEAMPPTSVFPEMFRVGLLHSYWTAVPFRL